jgi:hypothetical protein
MTSDRQIAANRRNALRSTGPRSPLGKAIVGQNPARHGLYSASPVIHGLESPAAWEQHRCSTIASCAPVGQLETDLAERVALILWRLKRITRYERDVTTSSHGRAFDDLNYNQLNLLHPENSPEPVRERLSRARARLRNLTRLAEAPPSTLVARDAAVEVMAALDHQLGDFDLYTVSVPEIAPDDVAWDDVPEWTVHSLRLLVDVAAGQAGLPPEQLIAAAIEAVRDTLNAARSMLRPYTRKLADLRRERILPQPAKVDHLIRYESHLTRQLEKTLAQLRALQQARRANPDPDPDPDQAHKPAGSGPTPGDPDDDEQATDRCPPPGLLHDDEP